MKYKKKPIVVEAWEWDESLRTLKAIGCKAMSYSGHTARPDECTELRIETLEGTMSVNKGDFIIKGVAGEFYPCNHDVFHKTYDPFIEPIEENVCCEMSID